MDGDGDGGGGGIQRDCTLILVFIGPLIGQELILKVFNFHSLLLFSMLRISHQ